MEAQGKLGPPLLSQVATGQGDPVPSLRRLLGRRACTRSQALQERSEARVMQESEDPQPSGGGTAEPGKPMSSLCLFFVVRVPMRAPQR